MSKTTKKIATRLWLALFLVLVTFSLSHADYVINNVPERIQEHSMWCWDASSQSMLNYYEHAPTQCSIANWAFSRTDCCSNPTDFAWWSNTNRHPCNSGNWLCSTRGMNAVLDNFGNVVSYCAEYPLPEYTVRYEADAHRPFGMRFDWTGGGAHALVARGYSSGNVHYMDPWPGNGYTVSTYTFVVSSSGHRWTRTLRLRNPGETNLISPSSTITDTTPTYSWQNVTDANYYRLLVRNSENTIVFLQWLSSSDYTLSGSTCYYTPPTTVLGSGTYRWWVQTYSGGIYGAMFGPWSNSQLFTVGGCVMPGKVTLISPSGAISTSTPTYRWYQNGPATRYQLYIRNDTDDRIVVNGLVDESSVCSGGVCSITPSANVDANDSHRWWIRGINSCGNGLWSDPLSFKLGTPGRATLISPSGTISTSRPTYTWTAVPSATHYQLIAFDYTTNQWVINQWNTASDAGCSSGTGNCSLTPATTLNTGSHRWWIKAFNGLYGDWSSSLPFYVSTACGFNEQFNSGNASLWGRFSGTWNVVYSAYYYTYGVTGRWAFSAIDTRYYNADYRAKLYRVGTSTWSNTLVVRASGSILSDGYPANCYMFQYKSDGYYSVYKRVNGYTTTLKYWTPSYYINRSNWNEMRAYVSGTYLYFSINGHYLWYGYDSSLSSGAFGLGMYRGSGGSLYVDWATLTCLSGAAGGEAPDDFSEISPEQQKLNAAADAEDQTRDETGAQ